MRLILADTVESAEQNGTLAAVVGGRSNRLDKDAIQDELDDMMGQLSDNGKMQPDEAMLLCSGFIARLTELYIVIQRIEHVQRELKSVRTQEVATLIEAVRDIWKIHSRLITVRSLDQELIK